jgi:hypothetical protein
MIDIWPTCCRLQALDIYIAKRRRDHKCQQQKTSQLAQPGEISTVGLI